MAAEVYQLPRQPDGKSFYDRPQSDAAPLRRSMPSSSNLFLANDSHSPSPPSQAPKRSRSVPTEHAEHQEIVSPSPPYTSSLDSSPHPSTADFSDLSSWSSSGRLSIDTKLGDDDHHSAPDFAFPSYGNTHFEPQPESSDDTEPSTTTDTTQSNSPLPTPTVADDTAVKQLPQRHVDYLSHDWREEDIWASWRHVVSQRKVYGERSRLENASWRTWAKSKNHLRTVPPEKLNWLKESDVTWLYGPLKPAATHPITTHAPEPTIGISKNSSFISKKPILKKRSMSEVMLQKSLSSSSLVKQAAASVQAQQTVTHFPSHGSFDRTPLSAPSQPPSRDQCDYFSIRAASHDTDSTPGDAQHEKHIRFAEKVEQCIAVDCKGGDASDDEGDDTELEMRHAESGLSESSSDEGLLMMKRGRRRRAGTRRRDSASSGSARRSNSFQQARMIAEIEATTLKSRVDGPDHGQEAQHHVFGAGAWSSPRGSHSPSPVSRRISPSPSQETLRPSRPSRNFLLAEDDDGGDEDDDAADGSSSTGDSGASWSFGASNPKSSLGAAASAADSDAGYTDDYESIAGMRRTASGMFMPYDGDGDSGAGADALANNGLFGRVSDTFNTMRDIGHVLYTAFRS